MQGAWPRPVAAAYSPASSAGSVPGPSQAWLRAHSPGPHLLRTCCQGHSAWDLLCPLGPLPTETPAKAAQMCQPLTEAPGPQVTATSQASGAEQAGFLCSACSSQLALFPGPFLAQVYCGLSSDDRQALRTEGDALCRPRAERGRTGRLDSGVREGHRSPTSFCL